MEKVGVGDKIKVTQKKDQYSMEYEMGDVFPVEGTWYAGVHVTGRTGIPLSLDREEYVVIEKKRRSRFREKEFPVDAAAQKNIMFHVNESGKVLFAVQNIQNLQSYYNQENTPVFIELVVNGEAVKQLIQGSFSELEIRNLIGFGVCVCVCNHAMDKNGITKEQLIEGVQMVSSGVVELAEKQFNGFAYIKP